MWVSNKSGERFAVPPWRPLGVWLAGGAEAQPKEGAVMDRTGRGQIVSAWLGN